MSEIVATLLPESVEPTDGKTTPGGVRMLGDAYRGEDGTQLLMFGCPGCGRNGAIPVGTTHVKGKCWGFSGEPGEPSTWTLTPSVNCIGCCGWHGHLNAGRWSPC